MRSAVALFVLLAACSEAADQPQRLAERVVEVKGVAVTAQVADDDTERAKGLMYVKGMAQDKGMLFVWPEAVERSFWMRNTLIPLDLLFIRQGKIVHIFENARPHDETGMPSGLPADMVLEVNAGWVKAHGIAPGDGVVLK